MDPVTPENPVESKRPPVSVFSFQEKLGQALSGSASPAAEKQSSLAPPTRRLHVLEKFQRISFTERTVFTQNLYAMLKSGISLSQAMGTLAEQTKNRRFVALLRDIKTKIEKGEGFAKALGRYPKYFSEVYISMVAAGEATGRLESILAQLAKQMKKERILLGKIRGAMFYPIIVISAMIVIGIAMMVFVIPKITDIYTEVNAQLPLPTTIIIGISSLITNQGFWALGILVALLLLLRQVFRSHGGRRFFHALLLRLPIAGMIVKKVNLARFSRTLHSLLQTDIPVVQSFQIIERTLGNIHYQEAILEASESLKRGVSIVEALRKRPHLFPPMVTQMISVGEESGTLDSLADEIATFYEEDVDETMNNFSSVIEPILLLILGVGVALMAVAILLPMYSLTEQI